MSQIKYTCREWSLNTADSTRRVASDCLLLQNMFIGHHVFPLHSQRVPLSLHTSMHLSNCASPDLSLKDGQTGHASHIGKWHCQKSMPTVYTAFTQHSTTSPSAGFTSLVILHTPDSNFLPKCDPTRSLIYTLFPWCARSEAVWPLFCCPRDSLNQNRSSSLHLCRLTPLQAILQEKV